MRAFTTILFVLLGCSFAQGQLVHANWFSETNSHGITIQNSFPKGGAYLEPTTSHYYYSYLVFFSRVKNDTGKTLDLEMYFSADSIAIPNSPDTFVKLFLPPDTMALEKQELFSYGFSELKSLYEPTSYRKKLRPNEECFFYVVAVFFQTKEEIWLQERGGNRAELVIKGNELFYKMPPQVEALPCGKITFAK